MTPLQTLLTTQFGDNAQCQTLLGPLSYLKIGGPAEVLLTLSNEQELTVLASLRKQHDFPITLLGGASNVVIADQGIPGVVLRYENTEYAVAHHVSGDGEVNDKGRVRAGSGWKTSLFVRKTIDDGLTGLEVFLGVPGTVGGAIYNNSHYLEQLIGEHIISVRVFNMQTGVASELSKAECDFAYDHSRFQTSGEIILSAEWELEYGTKENSQELVRHATMYRAKTQPLGIPNSGCYFRNVPNTDELRQRFPQFAQKREVPAGFLIDQAGLKGFRIGAIEVSHVHASFLVNHGGGTSNEVRQVAQAIQQKVFEQFHVTLQPEVFWLGEQTA